MVAISLVAPRHIGDVALVAHISENTIILIYCIYLSFISINYYYYYYIRFSCVPVYMFIYFQLVETDSLHVYG
jgi:hypothetical protein